MCPVCVCGFCHAGVVGSAIADESRLQDNFPDWLKGKNGDLSFDGLTVDMFEWAAEDNIDCVCVCSGVVGIAATDENNLLDLIFLWTEGTVLYESSL